MVTIGVRRLILKPQRPLNRINYLRVLGIALSKIYYTQTNCIIASDILAVRGLAGWCQTLHTAAVRAGYSQCGLWGGT